MGVQENMDCDDGDTLIRRDVKCALTCNLLQITLNFL